MNSLFFGWLQNQVFLVSEAYIWNSKINLAIMESNAEYKINHTETYIKRGISQQDEQKHVLTTLYSILPLFPQFDQLLNALFYFSPFLPLISFICPPFWEMMASSFTIFSAFSKTRQRYVKNIVFLPHGDLHMFPLSIFCSFCFSSISIFPSILSCHRSQRTIYPFHSPQLIMNIM